MEILQGIWEIITGIGDLYDLIKDFFGQAKDTVSEITDVFVQGGTEVIGFADAVAEPVEISKGFLTAIFPGDIVFMFGIAFTVIIALATRRSVNA